MDNLQNPPSTMCSDGDSDEEYSPVFVAAPGDEDRDILKGGNQALGLDVNYVPDWEPCHAIREFYQNWKDAIKDTSRLHRRDFTVIDNGFNPKGVYTIEARHPDTSNLLGYISLDKGILEITNFNAALSRRSLRLGVTSKRDDDDFAGTHGEGYKLGALVMTLAGYNVRYEADSWIRNFNLPYNTPDELYCRFTRMAMDKRKTAFATKVSRGLQRELKANPWEDVSLKIGSKKTRLVTKADFLEWIKVSLDLDRPSKMLHTRDGSLILDEKFNGKIYLKGLLMDDTSLAKPFKYGYNFFYGEVNRDRERLRNSNEEARMLGRIWVEAIRLEEATTLPHLVDMLQSDTLYADVDRMEENIPMATARKIRHHILAQDPTGKRFFYDAEEGGKDVELITKSLKREAFPLKKATWLSLRRHQLLRTAEEERYHCLQNAPISTVQRTTYSEGLERMLRSALALDNSTKNFDLEFRSGGATDLDMLLEGNTLLINDKWLDFDRSHEEAPCSLSFAATDGIEIGQFSCTHILTELYELILVEVSKHRDEARDELSETHASLRRKVNEKIHQMPCMVETSAPRDTFRRLDVTWVHPESSKVFRLYGLEWKGQVNLHRESTCREKRCTLLAPGPIVIDPEEPAENRQENNTCDCASKIVSLKDSQVTFEGLDHTQEYFPMLSRIDPQAFYAFPPPPARPNAAPLITTIQTPSSAANRIRSTRPSLSISSNPNRTLPSSSPAPQSAGGSFSIRNRYQNLATGLTPPNTPPDGIAEMRSELQNAVTKLEALKREVGELRTQLVERESQMQDKDATVKNRGERITALERDLAQKEQQLSETRRLSASLTNLESSSLDRASKSSSMSDKVKQLQTEIKALTRENEELNLDYQTATQLASSATALTSRAAARGLACDEATRRSRLKRESDEEREQYAKRARLETISAANSQGVIDLDE